VSCLLSGLEVFNNVYDEQTRFLRLVKGIHGFHVYATEYWTEYILSEAVSNESVDTSSPLFTITSRLAHDLDEKFPPQQFANTVVILDQRLEALKQHEILYRQIEYALSARSQKRILSEMLQKSGTLPSLTTLNSADQQLGLDAINRSSKNPFILDGVSAMLELYQKSVQILLSQDSCPGSSAEELDQFKIHFRTSAFTCRLQRCPRATLGFENEQLLREHEILHAGGFRCTFPGCQYPPLSSAKSLKFHVDRYHNMTPARKSIRRVEGVKSFTQHRSSAHPNPQTYEPLASSKPGDGDKSRANSFVQNPKTPQKNLQDQKVHSQVAIPQYHYNLPTQVSTDGNLQLKVQQSKQEAQLPSQFELVNTHSNPASALVPFPEYDALEHFDFDQFLEYGDGSNFDFSFLESDIAMGTDVSY
jgi:hypothetical protein